MHRIRLIARLLAAIWAEDREGNSAVFEFTGVELMAHDKVRVTLEILGKDGHRVEDIIFTGRE